MTETRMKSRLFTSRLGEKIIFGMETQMDITQTPIFSKAALPSGCGCDVKK